MAKPKTPAADAQTMIPLNRIVEWEFNPRRTRDDASVAQSASSILAQGQLMPLLVSAATDGSGLFHAIDGETRRQGMNANVDAGKAEPDMLVAVRVIDPSTTPSQLLAIAIAANTVRQQMNPIEEMEAYYGMVQSGMKPRAIGETFNLSTRQVMQRIGLGSLVDGARDLVRSGQRQLRWAEAMTMGSNAQQERIVAEIGANPAAYADAHSVRAELTRGNIPTESALFDPSELSDCLVTDLFTMESGGSFSDSEAFWKRQMVEVQKKIDELSATHKDVRLFDRTRFSDAGWATGGEPSDSVAVIITHEDGSVVVREGMVPPAFENEADDGEGSFLTETMDGFAEEHEEANAPVAKVEVNPLDTATKDTADYLLAQIVASLKLKAASDHRVAMAFVVAATLTRSGGLAGSMPINGIGIDIEDQTSDVFRALATRRSARDAIARNAGINGMSSPAKVVRLLLALGDQALQDIFAWSVSEAIAAPMNETTFEVYDAVGLEVMSSWRIEASYLETLTNGQIRTLASEVVEIQAQPSPKASIQIVSKAILEAVAKDDLQGNWVGASPSWLPPQVTRLQNSVAARAQAEADAAASAATDDAAIALAA